MKNPNIKPVAGLSVAFMLFCGVITVALSNDVADGQLSPNQIFEKSQAAYASLASYSDEGQVVASMNDTIITTRFAMRLARTNFYLIEWQQIIDSFNATNITPAQAVWSSGAGNLLETGHGPQDEASPEMALAKATEISGGAAGTIPRTFFNLQWGDQLKGSGFNQDRQPDEKVGDIDCYVFTRESQGRTKTLWIGRQDLLIHQVRTVYTADALQSMMVTLSNGNYERNANIHRFTTIETHNNIILNHHFTRSDFIPANGE